MHDFGFQRVSETVHAGFATPYLVSGLPGTLAGCIYRSDGSKVLLSERLGGFKGDLLESKNPQTIAAPVSPRHISGRGLYLGNYMGGHYGHFITETLSTFWMFEEHSADKFDYFLFHPYVFGDRIPGYVKSCLDRFGIDPEKIIFVGSEALALEEIVVPERLFRLNHSADPRLKWVYSHIAQGVEAPQDECPRLYLSRRRINQGSFDRVVANEVDVEAEFRKRGFVVVYPETMSFEEQVGRYCRATWLAGMSGSGLHNSVFMQSRGQVIELGDPRYDGEPAPTQTLCNGISGVRSTLIPFAGPRFGARGTMLFDMKVLRDRLDQILGPQPDVRGSRAGRRALSRRTLDTLEVAYLAIRPSAGLLARRLLKRLGVRGWRR